MVDSTLAQEVGIEPVPHRAPDGVGPAPAPLARPQAPLPPGAADVDPAPGGPPRRVPQVSPDPARLAVPPGRPAATAMAPVAVRGGARRLDAATAGLERVLTGFAARVPGAANAAVVSTDGVVVATSEHLDGSHAAHVASILPALAELTGGAAQCFDAGETRQLVVEMEAGFLLLAVVDVVTWVAAFATPDCDLGLVREELARLVERVRRAPRPAPAAVSASAAVRSCGQGELVGAGEVLVARGQVAGQHEVVAVEDHLGPVRLTAGVGWTVQE